MAVALGPADNRPGWLAPAARFAVGFGLALGCYATWHELSGDEQMTLREWAVMSWVLGASIAAFGIVLVRVRG